MIEPSSAELLWLVIVGFLVAFVLAFGIGANDVANSFGTSVGSKVLTVRQACYLATVFEIAGAMLIGYKVSDTMRKDLLDIDLYMNAEKELMLGCLASLASSGLWLILATFLKLPISGTHSIVGSTVGFSLVCRGTQGLHWRTLGTIGASWIISPLLSGGVSVCLFLLIRVLILRSRDPLSAGLCAMPFFYGFTIFVNVFSIVHNGPKLLYFDRVPLWGAGLISTCVGVFIAILVQVIVVPRQRKKILDLLRRERNPGVSFTCGGSTDSSREGSPKRSQIIPGEGLMHSPLSRINEVNELSPSIQLNSDQTNAQQTFRFNIPPMGSKTNGYFSAETALNNPMQNKNGLMADAQQLSIPGSGQDTPADGMSRNSSAVPLLLKDGRDGVPEAMKLMEGGSGGGQSVPLSDEEPFEIAKIFSFLQVLTASFGSFAHGGNDVSNAIGPLIAMWLIYHEGSVQQRSDTPLFILLYGGFGISVGLWLWGRRVIQTIGEDLTKITASTGFTIEVGAALTVLLASKIGIPISTTHCKVGSVVFVGFASTNKSGVDWKLFRNIIYAWVVTVPMAAGLSALFMVIFRAIFL